MTLKPKNVKFSEKSFGSTILRLQKYENFIRKLFSVPDREFRIEKSIKIKIKMSNLSSPLKVKIPKNLGHVLKLSKMQRNSGNFECKSRLRRLSDSLAVK